MNAKEYLEMASRRKGTDSAAFDLPMPSGAIWRVLPISLQAYLVSGRLPMHLLSKMSSLKSLNDPAAQAKLAEQLSGIDLVNMLAIARDAMLNNVIEPRISLEPSDDSLLPEQIIPEDFEYFIQFVFSGGQAAQANSFRQPANGAAGAAFDPGSNGAREPQAPEPDTFS